MLELARAMGVKRARVQDFEFEFWEPLYPDPEKEADKPITVPGGPLGLGRVDDLDDDFDPSAIKFPGATS